MRTDRKARRQDRWTERRDRDRWRERGGGGGNRDCIIAPKCPRLLIVA